MTGYDAWHFDDIDATAQQAMDALCRHSGMSITIIRAKRQPFRINPLRLWAARILTLGTP